MSTESDGELSFAEKVRSLGFLSGGRTRTRIHEGRQHPESGVPFKTTITEAGTVTEHATRDDRVDATARPETVRVIRDTSREA